MCAAVSQCEARQTLYQMSYAGSATFGTVVYRNISILTTRLILKMSNRLLI